MTSCLRVSVYTLLATLTLSLSNQSHSATINDALLAFRDIGSTYIYSEETPDLYYYGQWDRVGNELIDIFGNYTISNFQFSVTGANTISGSAEINFAPGSDELIDWQNTYFNLSTTGGIFNFDMVYAYEYDEEFDVTFAGFRTTPLGSSVITPISDGAPLPEFYNQLYPEYFIEMELGLYALAYIDNPYPELTGVPVPAAAWMFATALCGLGFQARRRK